MSSSNGHHIRIVTVEEILEYSEKSLPLPALSALLVM